jgi:NAD(P)-dependent dehydrogenase (short-subunit alcohol dehydrogenase family)
MSFQEKNIIVTGGANGIGRTIVTAFAKKGAKVVIADIDQAAGKKLEEDLLKNRYQARFIRTDVSDPESAKTMVHEASAESGPVDILINNAGISEFTPFFNLDIDSWDHVINTNLRGAFICSQACASEMKKNGVGAIINIASTRAMMSEPGSEAYAASKGGLLALTHAMAASLSEYHISVNAISPGWIHTGDYSKLREIDHKQHLSRRVGKPEDIARVCLFLAHPENNFITGENLVIDGGMTRKMIYEN